MNLRKLLPSSFFNMTSFVGAAIAAISISLIVFLVALELFSGHSQAYMGIITFVLLPVFFMGGLVIVAFGMWTEKRRRARSGSEEGELPAIDFNDPAQENGSVGRRILRPRHRSDGYESESTQSSLLHP